MRSWWLIVLLVCGMAQAQSSGSASSTKTQSPDASSSNANSSGERRPNLDPPRSDRVNVDSLGNDPGESSSKEDPVDLSPPADDSKTHPHSSETLEDEGSGSSNRDLHPWDPHKAAKDVEVGDFYFKKKNYIAAESRYREALLYKDNDAIATYKLAICLEKQNRPDEARAEYESYLKILPNGPESAEVKKAMERLKAAPTSAKSVK
ncbi:MAG TPA: tetratricopeptide repeat protein [Candidatus Sulfotelmatobacter sp.]|nr:tetratricopeptide repeat protein [Candidatus Sulfotelmatobacter sp.]